jgi:hypothetical protein
MKILQRPISDNHKSSMFFDGIIAESRGYKLATYQDGEISFNNEHLIGQDIIKLAQTGIIDDDVIEEEYPIDILVDKYICIFINEWSNENLIDIDKLYFDNYDEAIKGFEDFLL